MLNRDLNDSQRQKLDKCLIKMYCNQYQIDIDQNINAQFQSNEENETIAMWLIKEGKLVPKQWMHNYNIKNKDGKTLKDLMIEYNMSIPHQWQSNVEMSIFDQAYFGIIPNIENHKPDERNEQGQTVAIILSLNGIIPPKQWQHHPLLYDNNNDTVAGNLAYNYVLPPKEWEAKIQISDFPTSSQYFLKNNGYIYFDEWLIPSNYLQQQTLNTMCQLCFKDGEQTFIVTICGHNICLKCFKQLNVNRDNKKCPICRQENWFQLHQQLINQEYISDFKRTGIIHHFTKF